MISLTVWIVIYLYLSAAGLGLYSFTCPRILKNRFLVLWLIPCYGAMNVVFISSYFFTYGYGVERVALSVLLLSAFFLACAMALRPRTFWLRELALLSQIRRFWIGSILVPGLLLLLLLTPVFNSDGPQTPLHIGPDPIGAVIGAEYLRQGGTKPELETRVLAATRKSNLREALDAANFLVNWTQVVQSDSLLLGRRWGVPFVTATLTKVTAQNIGFNVIFLSVLFFYWGLYAVSAWALSCMTTWRGPWVYLGAFGLSMNCNLLNLIWEGGYAQLYAMPLFLIAWALFFFVRPSRRSEFWRQSLFLALSFGFILLTYSELFYVLGLVGSLTAMIRLALVWKDKDRREQTVFVIVLFGAAFSITFLLSTEYLVYSLLDLPVKAKYAASGGWIQPRWALPGEIFGFFNIYADPLEPIAQNILLPRSWLVLAASSLVSLAIVFVFIARFGLRQKSQWLTWFVPTLFILAIFFKLKIAHQINNYQYMKSYTYMLPLLWWALWEAAGRASERAGVWSKVAMVAMVTWISGVGLSHQIRLNPYFFRTSSDLEQLSQLAREENLSDSVIFTAPHESVERLVQNMLLGAYFSMNWGDNPLNGASLAQRDFGGYLDKKVTYLLPRDRLRDTSRLIIGPDFEKVVSVGRFVLAKSRLTVRDGFNPSEGRIDLKVLMQPYLRAVSN